MTYSKNNGLATVEPVTWASWNRVYKYGSNEYLIDKAFFDEATTCAPIATGSWSLKNSIS